MRILQIATRDWGGGAEGSAWNLFRAYRERAHTRSLVVGRKHSDDPDVYEIPRSHGWLRILAGGKRRIDRRLGREDFNYPATRQLLSFTPERPDIVHAHNLHSGYFDLRFLVHLSQQVPVILNLRDMWLLTGHCAHSFGCERWKTGCGRCPDLSIYPPVERDATAYNWRRKRDIYAHSRLYITTVSHWLMHRVQESMLVGAAHQVIPNGIDLTIFRPGDKHTGRRELGLPLPSRIVLYAANGGSESPWRDFRQLETAMRELAVSGTEELVLVCLGQQNAGQDWISGKLRVKCFGFEGDPKRMALYYQAADIYALPALAEAFGKTITEAMACGTPVVATAVGGIAEQIVHGETGFLVPKSDVNAMAAAIRRLLGDVSLQQRMGIAAADHARRFFCLQRQVDSFLSWYAEVRRDWLQWRVHEKTHDN